MAIRSVLKMGDSRLLRQSKRVQKFNTIELDKLIEDLYDTMHATHGVGIAAPQIGVNLQVVVFGFEENDRYPGEEPVPQTVLINPIIKPLSDELEDGWEGCLSVPGLRGLVPRYKHILYQGVDAYGQTFEREAYGFHARVVQHECDHLHGRLYPTRIKDMTQFGFTDVLFNDRTD